MRVDKSFNPRVPRGARREAVSDLEAERPPFPRECRCQTPRVLEMRFQLVPLFAGPNGAGVSEVVYGC